MIFCLKIVLPVSKTNTEREPTATLGRASNTHTHTTNMGSMGWIEIAEMRNEQHALIIYSRSPLTCRCIRPGPAVRDGGSSPGGPCTAGARSCATSTRDSPATTSISRQQSYHPPASTAAAAAVAAAVAWRTGRASAAPPAGSRPAAESGASRRTAARLQRSHSLTQSPFDTSVPPP